MTAALQVGATLAVPLLLIGLERRSRVVRAVGPVVLCYIAGIAAAALGAPIDGGAAESLAGAAIALALPLLLFRADVRGWLTHAPRAVLGYALAALAACVWGLIAGRLFADAVPDAPAVAGMFVGTYTGSTPNMAAVARALDVPTGRFVLINAADLIVGATWLAALLGFGARIARGFLPPWQAAEDPPPPPPAPAGRLWLAVGPLLAAGCVAFGLGLARLLPAHADAATLLGLSAAATALSFVPAVRALPGTDAVGRYGMLVFCAAAGSLTDLAAVVGEQLPLLAMAAVVMYGAIATHLGLCRLVGLDRDTALITGAGAIMGPALIPPIVEAMGNRRLLLSGLSTALVGLVVGTWLGLGVAWLLG